MARQKEMARAIDKEFEEADDTGVLDISGRNLRQFPVISGELLDYTYVFEADFSNNRFDKLPKEIIGFKALVKLNFHHNSIRWLLEEIYLLTNLKEVDMSRNFLTKIPSEICGMNLYSMNFNNNRLLSLPREIGKLKNLQFLDLSCNSISELPESFFSLSSLRHLNLHRNNLRDLPDDICQLTELQHLDVSSNLLTRLPITLRHMESIQVFTADDNPLESPPPQICSRGYVHLCKYLETVEKKGSDHHLFLSGQRDESLRRRKERQQKKLSYNRPLSESTPVRNGGERGMGLLDEMSNFIPTLREKDGERTPTGGLHWSVAQYISSEKSSNMSSQSKEEYREANYRLYMQQEGHKKPPEPCPSSPAGSSSLNEVSTTPTLSGGSKRMSDENVYRSSTSGSPSSDSSRPTITGRSLSNEKFPRSGSWNAHMRVSSPVLPSKYVAASERQSEEKRPPSADLSSKSADNLSNAEPIPAKTSITKRDSAPAKTSPPSGKPGKRPAPLDPKKNPQNGEKGNDSDREGSLTPTNEAPPTLELDDPPTPKDEKTFDDLDTSPDGSSDRAKNGTESHPPVARRPSKPLPPPPANRLSAPPTILANSSTDIEIRDLERSPPSLRRLPSLTEEDRKDKDKDKVPPVSPEEAKWQRLASPRRKKEKDVFKFLKENDANYTVRRQQMQMNMMLEKHKNVKQTVESLVGVELSEDLGEWISDGVVLCKVVNKLHPGIIANIHTPSPGQALSSLKQTINISAFIDACRQLKVPEEELCSAGDIRDLKDPLRVITCVQRVLETKPGNLI